MGETMHKKLSNSVVIVITVGLLLGRVAIAADTAQHFKIPPQSLNNALMKLAGDSNLEIIFAADKVGGIKTNTLDGTMTPTQALSQLLQGSGMTFRFVDAGTVTIEPSGNFRKTATTPNKPEPQSSNGENGDGQTLPKVTVEADSAYDPEYYADPYNKDYVLPNATVGTKTDMPIMETPLNVQVISKQVLKDQQVIRLTDSLKNVSGVTTNSSNSIGFYGGKDQYIFCGVLRQKLFSVMASACNKAPLAGSWLT
jgi:iron complex outermembrane receptor protein